MTFRERLEAARLESAKAYERAQTLEERALAKGREPMERAARDKMARRLRPENPRPGPMAWKLGRALLPWLRETFVNDWPFEDDTGFEERNNMSTPDETTEAPTTWPLYEIDTDDVCTIEGFDGIGLMTGDVRDGLRMTRETARTLADRLHAILRATEPNCPDAEVK